jgi:hypothetical protein
MVEREGGMRADRVMDKYCVNDGMLNDEQTTTRALGPT